MRNPQKELKDKRDIQLEILTKLLSALSLRYSEAHPYDVPNDLYNYHLQFLVKKGLVKKDKNKYSLTAKGIKYVAETRPLSPSGVEPDRFKLNVLTIVVKKEKGKILILNQIRKRHPFYGDRGIMGGSIKKGEGALAAAKRKLKEETGLEADFKLIGLVRKMIFTNQTEVFSDILFHLCTTNKTSGELATKTKFGDNFYTTIDEAIKNELNSTDPMSPLIKFLKSIKANKVKKSEVFYAEDTHFIT